MEDRTTPLKGRITSYFGERVHPVSGKRHFHNGVDIAVPVGTWILAPEDGRITSAWDENGGGICLQLEGGNRRVVYGFAHLSKRLVVEGQIVKRGDHIADSGNTGVATGPHLHLTVRVDNYLVDPLEFFNYTIWK